MLSKTATDISASKVRLLEGSERMETDGLGKMCKYKQGYDVMIDSCNWDIQQGLYKTLDC